MFIVCLLLLAFLGQECRSQDEEDGPYRGKLIGKLNTYHHQVSGDVYAVDDWTILLVNFNYDGTGEDTFFRAGDTGRPGPQGFIVPDEHGKTNILERYHEAEVRLALPEGKRVSRLKWFAVYDINSQNAFGDVFVPDEFESPAPADIAALAGDGVSSRPLRVLDAHTILIPEFRYDGSGEEVYFWTGNGPQPSANGQIIPNELGYLEPLRAYDGEDVRLQLPGALTVAGVQWVAVWDAARRAARAAALLPADLNVPPAAAPLLAHRPSLPNCKQLHRDLQVAWEVFGNQITIELAGLIGEDEYMSFGISGSASAGRMVGADVAVARYVAGERRGRADDYNLTEYAPCTRVLGAWRGACPDARLGALDSNQVLHARREPPLTVVSYRRALEPDDGADLEWPVDRPAQVVWAVGPLDADGAPGYHRLWPRAPLALRLTAAGEYSCGALRGGAPPPPPRWEPAALSDPALRVFHCAVGPAGGPRGLPARRPPPPAHPPLAWYVNGQLAPDIVLRRGLVYTFKVSGGNDPHSATEYHPLVVVGRRGPPLEALEGAAAAGARVLAGAARTRRGRWEARAAGPLCRARRPPAADPRADAAHASFRAFNRSLVWACEEGAPAELRVAPNASWPDTVYYDSFTHAGMGGRVIVVDKHRRTGAARRGGGGGAATAHAPAHAPLAALLLALLLAR